MIKAQFKLETQGGDFQTLVTAPIAGNVQYFNPVTPVVPVYADFPEEPGSNLPDPSNPNDDDQPPFDADDVSLVTDPTDPSVSLDPEGTGEIGLVWDDNNIWKAWDIPTTPTYGDITPADFVAATDTVVDV
ncbi:MAG: hypothetical protein ACYTEQ_29500, partial [Planctomycetota bacterium]